MASVFAKEREWKIVQRGGSILANTAAEVLSLKNAVGLVDGGILLTLFRLFEMATSLEVYVNPRLLVFVADGPEPSTLRLG